MGSLRRFPIACLVILWACLIYQVHANQVDDLVSSISGPVKMMSALRGMNNTSMIGGGLTRFNPIDFALLDLLPRLFGQKPANENGTKAEYEEYMLKDTSNDDAVNMSTIQLIERSGYKYEQHIATSDDGYMTVLTRIINPKADRRMLRMPPILMEYGGSADSGDYLIGSSIQHHPEKWPRSFKADGPITSWNCSLAFVLANNGFDVWLAGTRGSGEKDLLKVKSRPKDMISKSDIGEQNVTAGENLEEVIKSEDYWSFSQDDIIAYEFKSHFDTVMKVTGSSKVSLVSYSLSTPTVLSFLGLRPDYAEKVHGFVSLAPIFSGQGIGPLLQIVLRTICPLIPEKVGTLVLTDMLVSKPVRDLIIQIAKVKPLRYSLIKSIVTLIFGPSAKYQTSLDLNVIGHLSRELSFREVRQVCQQTQANKLQFYDYGPAKNRVIYKSPTPPEYDVSNLRIKDWLLVTAANDAIATPAAVQSLLRLVGPKPAAHIVVPGFNHIDLFVGVDNDVYCNLPILSYFERISYLPQSLPFGARSLDLEGFLAPLKEMSKMLTPAPLKKPAENYQGQQATLGTDVKKPPVAAIAEVLNPVKLVESFGKNVQGGIQMFMENPLFQMFKQNNKTNSKPSESKPTNQ